MIISTRTIATKKLLVNLAEPYRPGRRYNLHTDFSNNGTTDFQSSYTVILTTYFKVQSEGQIKAYGEIEVAGYWTDDQLLSRTAQWIDRINLVEIPMQLFLYTRPLMDKLLCSIGYPGFPLPAPNFPAMLQIELSKKKLVPDPINFNEARDSVCAIQ